MNHKDTVEAPNRLRVIQKRYTGTATPSNTYEVRADDLAWLINEVELRCARVDPPAAPAGDEDRELAKRLRTLLSDTFITGHMHGPSKDYQVQLKFRTLEQSQRCHTLIEALVHPEYRESFIKQGVLEPLAAAPDEADKVLADLGPLTVEASKEIADKALLNALRKERADQDDFWTFYKADPLMVKAADRVEELLAWYGTEQSMHAAWRKRAEEAESALAQARKDQRRGDAEFFCHWLLRAYEAIHRDTSYEEGETLDNLARELNQVIGFAGYEPESEARAELLKKEFSWTQE